MKVLCFDLELNQPSNKIIQIGWCVGETNNGNIYVRKDMHVNPHEELSDFIKKLTGITQEQVELGYPLDHVYRVMCQDHKAMGCFVNPAVWGTGDSYTLRKQLQDESRLYTQIEYDDAKWPLGRRTIDVKTLYQAYRTANNQGLSSGLAKSMRNLGLQFEGKKHSAQADAVNTFRVYCKLLDYFRVDTAR